MQDLNKIIESFVSDYEQNTVNITSFSIFHCRNINKGGSFKPFTRYVLCIIFNLSKNIKSRHNFTIIVILLNVSTSF